MKLIDILEIWNDWEGKDLFSIIYKNKIDVVSGLRLWIGHPLSEATVRSIATCQSLSNDIYKHYVVILEE
jgi:hypothetical protein